MGNSRGVVSGKEREALTRQSCGGTVTRSQAEGEKVKIKSAFVKTQIIITARAHTHAPETMFLVCSLTSLGVSLKDE